MRPRGLPASFVKVWLGGVASHSTDSTTLCAAPKGRTPIGAELLGQGGAKTGSLRKAQRAGDRPLVASTGTQGH